MNQSMGTRTNLTPFPRNSSPNATPRALINLRLKVDAVLIPGGKPVPPFVARNLTIVKQTCGACQQDGLPCRSIVHAKIWDIETGNWMGVANTPGSKLALACQNPDLLV